MNRDISFHIKRGGLGRRQWRFVIVSVGNHEVIAVSELYRNRADCEATCQLIKDQAASAQIVT